MPASSIIERLRGRFGKVTARDKYIYNRRLCRVIMIIIISFETCRNVTTRLAPSIRIFPKTDLQKDGFSGEESHWGNFKSRVEREDHVRASASSWQSATARVSEEKLNRDFDVRRFSLSNQRAFAAESLSNEKTSRDDKIHCC